MNIVLTGSLGNISQPLAVLLVQQGHAVTVISSKPDKRAAIEALGAKAAIGSFEDAAFLTETFTGADAVYCMIPLSFTEQELSAYFHRVTGNYLQAIRAAGVKRVVHLSGWAANILTETNPANDVEGQYAALPDVAVTHLRPPSLYSNFYQSVDLVRGNGTMGRLLALRAYGLSALFRGRKGVLMGNFGGDDPIALVSPKDIATAAAEELTATSGTVPVRYVASEELTCNEAAAILGKAIGKPWLKWVRIPGKQLKKGMESMGVPPQLAALIVDMQEAIHTGAVWKEYRLHQPEMGKERLAEFAKEFAVFYNRPAAAK